MKQPAWFAIIALVCCGCHSTRSTSYPAVIVVGVDGMDPGFVERHWSELPNLATLRDQGSFSRLATTTPPQSPVAWSSFITGLPPAEHGVFDFVERDPATLGMFSSMASVEESKQTFGFGPYLVPLSSPRIITHRMGAVFWQGIAEKGIPVEIMHMPTNYPPIEAGRAIAGMGAPDLVGTLGTFTFFTDDLEQVSQAVAGGRIVKVSVKDGRAVLPLEGPPNTLRRDRRATVLNLIADIDSENPAMRLKAGDETRILREGEWSDWLPVSYDLIPRVTSVKGMVRVFVRQLHPNFELYVSPINIDPNEPAMPVSWPARWAKTVAMETGRFTTLGIPEDTSALRQNVLTLEQFRQQTELTFAEERALMRYSLRHFEGGLLFFYFSSVDQNSHILWGKHDDELLKVYREVDSCIGEIRRSQPGARIIVMSDHGFSTFQRAVNLNTWLNHRGLLSVTVNGDGADLTSIEWPATQAYALGLNALYLNMKGREKFGTVLPSQRAALIENLREQLLAWRDPVNGRAVVETVTETKITRQNASVAPDLIIGYAPGYRASWQTGLGGVPREEIEDNNDFWIGDHCINAADVSGVYFSDRSGEPLPHGLEDVTRGIRAMFARR